MQLRLLYDTGTDACTGVHGSVAGPRVAPSRSLHTAQNYLLDREEYEEKVITTRGVVAFWLLTGKS